VLTAIIAKVCRQLRDGELESEQHGGQARGKTEGGNERGLRVSYGRIDASKGAGNCWDLNMAMIDARGVSTRDFWTGEEDDDLARHVGPVCQRGIRGKRVPF
jgi:hypothetical protein